MDLLDQYLATVKQYLPARQRDDILLELEGNLRAEIEEREGDVERSLGEAEQAAILQRFGNPAAVADRYRQDQRVLAFGRVWIGSLLFPVYLRVLTINASLAAIVCMVVMLVMGKSIFDALQPLVVAVAVQFAIVTLIFVIAENGLRRYLVDWDAREPAKMPPATDRGQSVSPASSFASFIINGLFMHWIIAAHHAPASVLGDAAADIAFGPVWSRVYWPLLLLVAANMIQAAISFFRPNWTRFDKAWQVASAAILLCVTIYVLSSGDWIIAAQATHDPEGLGQKLAFVNRVVFFPSLLSMAAIVAVHLLVQLRRLLRHPSGTVATAR